MESPKETQADSAHELGKILKNFPIDEDTVDKIYKDFLNRQKRNSSNPDERGQLFETPAHHEDDYQSSEDEDQVKSSFSLKPSFISFQKSEDFDSNGQKDPKIFIEDFPNSLNEEEESKFNSKYFSLGANDTQSLEESDRTHQQKEKKESVHTHKEPLRIPEYNHGSAGSFGERFESPQSFGSKQMVFASSPKRDKEAQFDSGAAETSENSQNIKTERTLPENGKIREIQPKLIDHEEMDLAKGPELKIIEDTPQFQEGKETKFKFASPQIAQPKNQMKGEQQLQQGQTKPKSNKQHEDGRCFSKENKENFEDASSFKDENERNSRRQPKISENSELCQVLELIQEILAKVRVVFTSMETGDPFQLFGSLKKRLREMEESLQHPTTSKLISKMSSITGKVHELVQSLPLSDISGPSLKAIIGSYSQTASEIFDSLLLTDPQFISPSRFSSGSPCPFNRVVPSFDQVQLDSEFKVKVYSTSLVISPNPNNVSFEPARSIETQFSAPISSMILVKPDILAVGSIDGSIKFFRASTGELVHSAPQFASAVTTMALCDGARAFVFGLAAPLSSAVIFTVEQLKPCARLDYHKEDITSITEIPGTRCVATGSRDSDICLWDMRKTSKPLFILGKHSKEILSLCCPSAQLMLSGGWDQVIVEWGLEIDEAGGIIGFSVTKIYRQKSPIVKIVTAISNPFLFFVATMDGMIHLTNRENGSSEFIREDEGASQSLFLCENDKTESFSVVNISVNSRDFEKEVVFGPKMQLQALPGKGEVHLITISDERNTVVRLNRLIIN